MYIAIILALVAVIGLILFLSMEFKLYFFEMNIGRGETKRTHSIPFVKYLFWLVSGWLSLVIINVAIIANETGAGGLENSLGIFYRVIFWLMWLLTGFWLIGFLFAVLQSIALKGEELL